MLYRYSEDETTPIFLTTWGDNYIYADNNYRANYVNGAKYTGAFILMLSKY